MMENQGFPTICIEKTMMKFLKKILKILLKNIQDELKECGGQI